MFVDAKRSCFPACAANERKRLLKSYRAMWDDASPFERKTFEDKADSALADYQRAMASL